MSTTLQTRAAPTEHSASYRGTGETHPIDRAVGLEIRKRRMLAGLSLEQLAGLVGVTYQQMQKYERGANRVSASRLYEIAQALGVSVGALFAGLEQPEEDRKEPLAMRTFRAFRQLPARERRVVYDLVRALAQRTER